jgi:hypothetical protein
VEDPASDLTFTGFVLSLGTTAAVHFGDIADPAKGRPGEPNLPAAARIIGLLEMLQQKTKGNLIEQEEKLIDDLMRAPAPLRPGASGRQTDHRTLKITFLGTGISHGVPMIGCECDTCRSDDPATRDCALRVRRNRRWHGRVD